MTITSYVWDPIEDCITGEFGDQGIQVARYTTEPSLYGNLISQDRNGGASFFRSNWGQP